MTKFYFPLHTFLVTLKYCTMTFTLDLSAPPPIVIMSVVCVIGVITIGVSYRRPGTHLPRSIFRTGSVVAHSAVRGSFEDITAGIGESLSGARMAQNGSLLHAHVTTRYRTLENNMMLRIRLQLHQGRRNFSCVYCRISLWVLLNLQFQYFIATIFQSQHL